MTSLNIQQNQSLNIKSGPSGRAVAQPVNESLLEALFQHLTIERVSSAQYFAMSLWFAERELRGFSSFFLDESHDEQLHANKFADYLIARGQTVLLHEVPKPRQAWKNVEDVIKDSFQMEADVTSSLQQLYSMAERSSDTRTTVFLDPVIDNQTNSEDEFAHLLGRVKFASNQPSALLIIDNELNKAK